MGNLTSGGFVLTVASLSLLGGCCTAPPPAKDPVMEIISQSCAGLPTPQRDAKFFLGGLEIPFKPNQPVKIGTLDFSLEDARKVSDAIYALSESRKRQCVYLLVSLRGVPPPSGNRVLQSLDGIQVSEKQADAVLNVLNTQGGDPKAAVAAAEKASAIAKEAEEKSKAALGVQASDNGNSSKIAMVDLPAEVQSGIRDIGYVKNKLTSVQGQIDDLRKAGPYRQFSIAGFDTGGVMMTSTMKDALSQQLSAALSSAPPALVPRVAIIGFADETGSYLANVDIGLRRAQSVAAYIARNFPKVTEIQIVSSGGVAANVPNGRRVDLLIS